MGSGKDAFYRLAKEINPSIVRVAFADKLKEEVAEATGCCVQYIEHNKKHFRLILQGWGTDFRRQLTSPLYWVEALETKLRALPEDSIVFVTDVRFHNEADMIRRLGGKIIRIVRINHNEQSNHTSETELVNIVHDEVIVAEHLDELRGITRFWMQIEKL